MAQMIPPGLPKDGVSPGEIQVFEWLKNAPGTEGWIAFHSYDLPKGNNGRRHEIDFIVMVPSLGIATVEVKGHKTANVNEKGQWRLGGDPFPSKNPVQQVLNTCYAFKRHVEPWSSETLKIAPLLVFTDAEVPQLPDLDADNLLSPRDGSVVERLVPKIENAVRKEQGSLLTEQAFEHIRKMLRPDFEVLASPLVRSERLKTDLYRATQDQQRVLDAIQDNPRVILQGPPGAGKTVIALEAARRASQEGLSTRVLCFNTMLGKKLKKDSSPDFPASSIFQFLVEYSGEVPPSGASSEWWLEFARKCAASVTEEDKVDFLVVDEMQDLMDPNYLLVLDSLVHGGLANGNWVMTGDSDNQDLYKRTNTDTSIPGNPTRLSLRDNCRNLEVQGKWIESLGQRPELFRAYLRKESAENPMVVFVDHDFEDSIQQTLKSLLRSHKPSEIVVLVKDLARQKQVTARLGIKAYFPDTPEVGVATFRTFKGLEIPVAIVETTLDAPNDEFITAGTRATEELVVLLPTSDQKEFIRRVTS